MTQGGGLKTALTNQLAQALDANSAEAIGDLLGCMQLEQFVADFILPVVPQGTVSRRARPVAAMKCTRRSRRAGGSLETQKSFFRHSYEPEFPLFLSLEGLC
jgi:hypothetical protein